MFHPNMQEHRFTNLTYKHCSKRLSIYVQYFNIHSIYTVQLGAKTRTSTLKMCTKPTLLWVSNGSKVSSDEYGFVVRSFWGEKIKNICVLQVKVFKSFW